LLHEFRRDLPGDDDGALAEIAEDLAQDDNGEADQGVGEAALGRLDGAHAAASGHPLIAGEHEEEGAHDRPEGEASGHELVEQADDGRGVHG
jgi:hypothetical protein